MIWEVLSLFVGFALVVLLAVLAFALEPLVLALWNALGRLTYILCRCTRTLLQICCKLKKYTPILIDSKIRKSRKINIESYITIRKKFGFLR